MRILCREGQALCKSQGNGFKTNKFENTPLHIAAKFGHPLIVKFLLQQGALVEDVNKDQKTALELATETVQILQSHLVDPDSSAKIGWLTKTQQLQSSKLVLQNLAVVIEDLSKKEQENKREARESDD